MTIVYFGVKLIALGKSRSVRETSCQPALMGGYMTVSHTCVPCLPSERASLFQRCLLVVGREVS